MKLYPHQEISRQFLLDAKRAILADQPRVGKTLPTAAAAAEHLPAMVVCPAIAKTVWLRAFEAINADLKVTVVNGKKEALFTKRGRTKEWTLTREGWVPKRDGGFTRWEKTEEGN